MLAGMYFIKIVQKTIFQSFKPKFNVNFIKCKWEYGISVKKKAKNKQLNWFSWNYKLN